MQRIQKTLYEKIFIGITGTAWIAGLLIAGSDSPYMPWLNGIGLILFFCASVVLGTLLNSSGPDTGIIIYPKFFQKPDTTALILNKKNQRFNTRYAMEA